MIRIMAPLNESCSREIMLSCADEFYVGIADGEWFRLADDNISFNTRGSRNGQACFSDWQELAEFLNMASGLGKSVYLTANTHSMDRERLPIVRRIIREFAGIGGKGVICSELNCLAYAKEEGMNAVLSTNMAVYSCRSLDYLCRHYEIDRLVLSRDMTLAEIREFRDSTDVELEVFGMNFGCRFSNGHCTGTHNHETGGFCNALSRVEWKYTEPGSLNEGADGAGLHEEELFQSVMNHRIYSEFFMAGACGLCALYRLNEMGIDSFKIVGRELPGKRIEQDTALAAYCRDMAVSCSCREEYQAKMEQIKAQRGIRGCWFGFQCYYPEER